MAKMKEVDDRAEYCGAWKRGRKSVTSYLLPEDYRKFVIAAREERRTVSQQMAYLIVQFVKTTEAANAV